MNTLQGKRKYHKNIAYKLGRIDAENTIDFYGLISSKSAEKE